MLKVQITDFKSFVIPTDGVTTEYIVTHNTGNLLETMNIELMDTALKTRFHASIELADSDITNTFKVVFGTPYPSGAGFIAIIK